jgi:hypothetical protein
MPATRRQFLVASAALAAAAGCAPTSSGPDGVPSGPPPDIGGPAPLPSPGSAGLVDEGWFGARVEEYLRLATATLDASSPESIIAHLVRARRDATFNWNPAAVTAAFVSTDRFRDTDDFALMSYQWVWRLGRGVLPDDVISAVEDAFATARYRYDDPLPAGVVDNKWFWSENHRIIFAVDEYLGGLVLPDRVFTITGLTGAQHAARTRQRIVDWIRERGRFGISEWHSNVYLKYSYSPLVTLVEFADDAELVSLAASALDLCLFDLASHTLEGAYGVTHGRTYKVNKTDSRADTTFGTAKLLFDTTPEPYQSVTDIGPTFLCGSTRYRLPEVIRRVATSTEVATIRERHGIHLDPHQPFSLQPIAPYGYDFEDSDNLLFWWSQGALTAWQEVPVTLEAANRWHLWDSALFAPYAAIRPLAGIPPVVAQGAARELAHFAAAGVLGEAHTTTWRSPDAMLSTVVDHRAGDAMEQAHAWQATLDAQAVVFTTHPTHGVPASLKWSDDDGYWTGTASMPRSAQHERAAIHVYLPAYDAPTDPLLGPIFGYEPYTHAFFPQDRFDEVVEQAGWVLGRKGDGYVALYSDRPTTWRVYDPATEATGGHTLPFDLLAPGGADNVWIVEVGRAADHGDFATFVERIAATAPTVTRGPGTIAVRYPSPTAGVLEFGSRGPFVVDGAEVPLRDHPRHSSPWAEVGALVEGLDVADGGHRLEIDFTHAARRVS